MNRCNWRMPRREMPPVRSEVGAVAQRAMHALTLSLLLLLFTMTGCAPLSKSLAVMNGGGSGGSVCEFSGLGRGGSCADAMAYVYLSDTWRDQPRVCGYLITWNVLGAKHSEPGRVCSDNLPSYCKSEVWLPGFDNETVKREGAELSARHAKKAVCDVAMTGRVRIDVIRGDAGKGRVVWSGAVFTNEFGKETGFSGEAGPPAAYCSSDVLVRGVSAEQLKRHGAYDEAVKKKAERCKSEGEAVSNVVQP